MATKTFSSRANERQLAYADSVTRERFGMSFGQYCGSILLDAVCQGADLPEARPADAISQKAAAIAQMKAIASEKHDEAIGRMSDDEIKRLIASRYE